MNTIQKGAITEQKCILKCLEMGLNVSQPVLPARYDLIIEINNKLIRVQVKTANWKDEEHTAFCFSCKSSHAISEGNKRMPYTSDEIDYFMTEKDNQFYLVPVEGNTSQKTLRISAPKSGNKTGFAWAKDYLFEEVIKAIH